MNKGVRVNVGLNDRIVAVALDYVDADRQSDRHQIEFWLLTVVRICRQVTDTRLALLRLRIGYPHSETPAELRGFFGCDVEFGAAGADADAPIRTSYLEIRSSEDGRFNWIANCFVGHRNVVDGVSPNSVR